MADESLYCKKVIDTFIKDKLCQGDALLYKYYQDVNVEKFKSRLSRIGNDEDVDVFIQTYITDAVRDVILSVIGELTVYMKPYGDLIISGGEAFNAYLNLENRIVTTDIDTKFTPVVKVGNKLITSSNPLIFGFIQCAKLAMWDKLGQYVLRFNEKICKRIQKLVINGPIGKLFGISFPKGKQHLYRRYTLIKKSKESSVLIDIELFAIDLQLRYYLPSEKKISTHNIGGILDIAFMRPNEFGFEATYTKIKGIQIVNPITKKMTHNNNIHIASDKFLIDDIYALQKYNLRPLKKSKDKQRMYIFCKYVFKIKNIKTSETLESMYRKGSKMVTNISTSLSSRPILTKSIMARAIHTDPYKYEHVTTIPRKDKIYKQLFYGFKGSNNLNIPGYSPTFSKYRFLANKGEWIKNNSPTYIHNEANYRPNKIVNYKLVPPLKDLLYGYNPARDSWMSDELVQKAAMIPLVGLKIKVSNT